MTLDEYQQKAQSFDMTKDKLDLDNYDIYTSYKSHALFGLAEECGELMGIFKRHHRGDRFEPGVFEETIIKELGDVLWYVAAVAASQGVTLEFVANVNIAKLEDRKARGKIKGMGDER